MNAVLIALLAVPAGTGLLARVLGRRLAPYLGVGGALATLVLAVLLLLEVETGARLAPVDVQEEWIPSLGIAFHIAVDGLNGVLVVMTAFAWFLGTLWSLRDKTLATPTYFLLLGLGQTAVLGAFVAQDLMLFVLCFDLMLLPFVIITAQASTHEGPGLSPAIKLLVYTLVGSLLMLVAAVALAILTAEAAGNPVTFDIATLSSGFLEPSQQRWILLAFLAAFLIKMPVIPLHGWFADAYRTMPLPALAIFAAVLSKVAAYGLLKIALPILPDAVVDWRIALVIIALVSIIYGSLCAFTTDEPRLILGYSSIAQLGFILLGISSLDPAGAQGAILQSVTHALVVVPAIMLVALVSERAGGIERLDQLGGLARRAPVLTAIFLVVALCWLAMPGTGNFVAEYLVLLGQWRVSPWAAIIASLGVVLAAAYALRLMIGALQNSRGAAIPEDAPEIGKFDATVLGTAVGALVFLSLVPQIGLNPGETASRVAVGPARAVYESERLGSAPSSGAQTEAEVLRDAIIRGNTPPGQVAEEGNAPEFELQEVTPK